MAEKARLQEHEGTGHIKAVVGKQREMNANTQLAFSFLSSLLPMLRVAFLTPIQSRGYFTDGPRGVGLLGDSSDFSLIKLMIIHVSC